MFSAREFMASHSPSSLFSAYASFMASMMLTRTILNDLIPKPIRAYLVALFHRLFKAKTSQLTLIDKCPGEKRISICLDNNEKLTDSYDGIELKWEFVCVEQERDNNRDTSRTGFDIRRLLGTICVPMVATDPTGRVDRPDWHKSGRTSPRRVPMEF
ncbi:hypothetical protein CRG98_034399 [Punica granatum]|uniref:AAA-type ATPase N-terminal domain-containing protein n=1 Tax=Punica granatum TaxID=22663 RepID=A0A2I0IMI0_PUNGR|nr:hypothetical protein CRG98_034399 [Punica granatum]